MDKRKKVNFEKNVKNEYDYDKNLNWRDDGDMLGDASMKDYLKGYQINPYEFKQWAKSKKNMTKLADIEVNVMKFTPEYLADRILTLWNGTDGTLQNFFEGFTLRYNNKLKLEIAKILKEQGYTVYPVLVDDKPRYAKIVKNVIRSNNIQTIMDFSKLAFKQYDGFNLFAGEIDDLVEAGYDVSKEEVSGILDYYVQIFPEDYALSLVRDLVDKRENVQSKLEEYKDTNLSDESLNKIENIMSGNADPYYNRDGGHNGHSFVTDLRSDTTYPNTYETRIGKKKS